jgi:hypothetical protein
MAAPHSNIIARASYGGARGENYAPPEGLRARIRPIDRRMRNSWKSNRARSNVRITAGQVQLATLTTLALIASLVSMARGAAAGRFAGDCAGLETHRDTPCAAHGGDVRLAGPFWLELVVAKGSLTVYVTDRSGVPVDTSGGKGTATAHTDGKATRIELRSAGGNRLAGKGKLGLKHSTVVFVTADLRGEKPYRAVFRPLERATAGAE